MNEHKHSDEPCKCLGIANAFILCQSGTCPRRKASRTNVDTVTEFDRMTSATDGRQRPKRARLRMDRPKFRNFDLPRILNGLKCKATVLLLGKKLSIQRES